MTTIGIPRGMLFYDYGSLWSDYFAILGVPCITSPEATKKTLSEGTMLGIDESCLPLKIFLGHVQSILDDCTHIFVPRIAQHHKNYYYCAKFAGLPDIVRNTFSLDKKRILSPNIEDKNFSTIYKACHTIAAQVGFSPIKSYISYRKALRNYKKRCSPSLNNQPNVIAVIGHSYLIHDPFLTQEIKKVVSAQNIGIITPDQVPLKQLCNLSSKHHPDVYWQLSAKLVGAAQYFSTQPNVKGILVVSSFGCGPDSLVNEYMDSTILRKSGKPYAFLNVDEHTGSAGLITRVEAFLDLIEWRR